MKICARSHNKVFFAIALMFLALKIASLHYYHALWWDASVYMGMGKQIYSLGGSGLWENSRPVIWPLILGLLWKLDIDPVIYGRILESIIGSFCVAMTYLIGRKVIGEKTAIVAAIFLAVSPTFFFFNGIMLTEVLSTFFLLLGVYFFIGRKDFISGIFFGAAFMTRFLQIIFFAIFAFSFLIGRRKNKYFFFMGFIILLIPYFLLNLMLYENPLSPFLQQVYLSKNTGWHNYLPPYYYLAELFRENILYIASFLGVILIFKNSMSEKDSSKLNIAFSFIIPFAIFSIIRQKEMRFLIILLPFMHLCAAFFISWLYGKAKNFALRSLIVFAVSLSVVFSIFGIADYYRIESSKHDRHAYLEKALQDKKINGNIWVSSPLIASGSDKKVSLLYYPKLKGSNFDTAQDADFVLLDYCDLECEGLDYKCTLIRNNLTSYLSRRFAIEQESIDAGCSQYVFAAKYGH